MKNFQPVFIIFSMQYPDNPGL